jgi:hypothetical protein
VPGDAPPVSQDATGRGRADVRCMEVEIPGHCHSHIIQSFLFITIVFESFLCVVPIGQLNTLVDFLPFNPTTMLLCNECAVYISRRHLKLFLTVGRRDSPPESLADSTKVPCLISVGGFSIGPQAKYLKLQGGILSGPTSLPLALTLPPPLPPPLPRKAVLIQYCINILLGRHLQQL